MPAERSTMQARGRIGGLKRAALAPDRQAITDAARAARWEKYRQQVLAILPELAGDDAEIDRRAEMLRQADMTSMSLKAARARRLKAEAGRLEAELAAEGAGELWAAPSGSPSPSARRSTLCSSTRAKDSLTKGLAGG